MKTTGLRHLGIFLTLLAPVLGLEAQEARRTDLANFDKRRDGGAGAIARAAEKMAAANNLKQRNPGTRIDWDDVLDSPQFIVNEQAFLSGPDAAEENLIPGARPEPLASDPHKAVKRFLNENSGLFGFDSAILTGARLSREVSTPHNGLRTVVWEQQLDGIPVFEALLYGHITKNGQLVSLSSQFVPALSQAADAGVPNRHFVQAFPSVSAQQAVAYAATNIGEKLDSAEVSAKDPQSEGAEKRQRFEANPLRGEITASLVWLPMNRQTMRLCWRVLLTGKTSGAMFQVIVDAETGESQIRQCWTFNANPVAYRVFPSDSPTPFSPGWSTPNTNQPAPTLPVLTNLVAISTNASPEGWITPGRTNTIGNNADARLDWANANPAYGALVDPPRPTGKTNNGVLTFDFALDLSQTPTNGVNSTSAVVNAFYWANWMHDKLYDLGFTESAGNYQQTNFGRGGAGGNDVLVNVQDGANDLTNFANNAYADAPPLDSMAGHLHFWLFTAPVPDRDSDIDTEEMLHEYTHLMTSRLVGHGAGISTAQSFGLSEGWSDFFALALLAESGDDTNGNYAWGAYANYYYALAWTNLLENYYYGSRRYPYSLNVMKNPLTFGDAGEPRTHPGIPSNPAIQAYDIQTSMGSFFLAPHSLGEVWCTALWEARGIYVTKYGFSNGTDRILRLVMDGMKLGPANPSFLQARDAILLADRVTTGGVDQTNLWTAFAKRGMGWSAICPASDTVMGISEAFDMPPPDGKLWAFVTGHEVNSSPAIGHDGTIYVGSVDAKLYAINPDGSLRWSFSSPYRFDSSPAVGLDGTVYVGGHDGKLYALTNGAAKWANFLGGLVDCSPAIGADGTVYVGVGNTASNVVAFSPAGTRLWAATLGTFHYVYSSAAIASNGTLYVGCMDGKIYALNATNGNIINSYQTGDGIYSSPAIAWDGSVYVGSLDGKVYGFDASLNLKSGWPFNTSSNIYCSPAIANDGTIYIGSDDTKLYSLNPNGSQRWSRPTGGRVRATPAIGADGTVFFGSYDWRMYSLGTNGATNWTYTTGFNIFSSPTLAANGALYVGSKDTKLYALPVNTYPAGGMWPTFRRNLRHTADAATLWLQAGLARLFDPYDLYQYEFQIQGLPGQSCSIECSTNLVNWTSCGSPTLGSGGTTSLLSGNLDGLQYFRVKSGDVKSLNALGVAVVTNPPSAQILMANPFNTPNNTVGGILPDVPEGMEFNKWNESTQSYQTNTFSSGHWSAPGMTLRPGEGGLLKNPLAATLFIFVQGEVLQGDLSNSLPAALSAPLSIRSSMVPQRGLVQTDLGYVPDGGDEVRIFTNSTFLIYTFDEFSLQWDPVQPVLEVGQAVFIQSINAKAWRRRYFVWP